MPIQLGTPGALRKYLVKARGDGIMWGRGPAQPFAAKVNASSKFDEVDIWNEWVQEDWQGGVGRVDPQGGGFLYGEVETRVPNQVILPQAPVICSMLAPADVDYSHWAYSPGVVPTDYTTYTVSSSIYLAVQVDAKNAGTLDLIEVWAYAYLPANVNLYAKLYTSSGGLPNTLLATSLQSATVKSSFPGPQWYRVSLSLNNIGTSTDDYFIAFYAGGGQATLYGNTGDPPTMISRVSTNSGSTWGSGDNFNPFFNAIVRINASADASSIPANIRRIVYGEYTGNVFYVANTTTSSANKEGLWYLTADNTVVWRNGGTANTPTDAVTIDDMIIVGMGNTADITPYASDGQTLIVSWGAYPKAKRLLRFGGYLYRSVAQNLYYIQNTDLDEPNWTGPFQVCNPPFEIQSMAGMAGDLYMACDDGLYRFAAGEVVEGITPWPESANNGKQMVSYGGALYIIVNGRVWRFTQDGALSDIWVSRDDDLPATRLGQVVDLAATDTQVVALVKESSTAGRGSIWAFQDESWHHVCTLPTANASVIYYDRTNSRLHIGTSNGQVFYVDLPQYATNPYNDTDSRYLPMGWLQQDRMVGGQYLLNKSWESVTVVGDSLSTDINVSVYWRDEESTAWELLGTATSDGQELRWSDYSTRPSGKWIKLGVLLNTDTYASTPRVRAIIVKFLPMVNDRIRDTLTLTLSDSIVFADSTKDTYTMAQQYAHLSSVAAIMSVDPVIYQDPLGSYWEVTVKDWSVNAPRYNSDTGTGTVTELEVNLVLEQMPNTGYTP